MTIAITFVSCFISLLEGHIKPSGKLGTAKRKPKLRQQRKNEEIISSNCLPHHKRASSFTNKHEAARLHLLPMLSRYRRMSDSVHHDKQCSSLHNRWCFRYDKQRSSLHAEGLSELLVYVLFTGPKYDQLFYHSKKPNIHNSVGL